MMQGLVLAGDAPLYGRANVMLDVRPLEPRYLASVLDVDGIDLLEHWTAWGGVPRYLELAATRKGRATDRLVDLALDPLGPLFSEPERLLLEESPTALEVRPLLDAIGAGAHRLSEIAGRLGRAATSLGKPLDRLLGMGLVRREVPYGEPLRGGKRSLYKIDDPFLRLWFRVVAPNRAALTVGTSASRRATLAPHWDALRAQAWEDLCRDRIPHLKGRLGRPGSWLPAHRYWHGSAPEWDVVADSLDHKRVLAGEAWFAAKPVSPTALETAAREVAARALPPMRNNVEVVRALFVPSVAAGARRVVDGVQLITQADLV
jgi:AAA+ ATPase superfamily predicted ATPase